MAGNNYDLIQAQRYLHMLDPETDKFCFQPFKKEKDKEPLNKPCFIGRLNDFESTFAQNQIGRYNITVVINETSIASRKLEDMQTIRVAFLDFDSKLVGKEVDYGGHKKVVEALDPKKLSSSSFPPHMIIQSSPGNYHAYWALQDIAITDTEASAVDYRDLQKALAYTWGGDPGVTGLNQCARLPGFWRFKDDDDAEPSLVSIIWESEMETRYMAGMLLTGLRQQYRKNNPKPEARKVETRYDEDADEEVMDTDDGGVFVTEEMRALAIDWLDAACREMEDAPEGGRDNLLNKLCYTAGGYVGSGSLEYEMVADRLGEAARGAGLDSSKIRDKLTRVIKQGEKRPIVSQSGVINPSQPAKVAEKFLKENYTLSADKGGMRTIHHWRGYAWVHEMGRYNRVDDTIYRDSVAKWLQTQKIRTKSEEGKFTTHPYHPKMKDYNEVRDQSYIKCRLPESVEANTWLVKGQEIPDAHCVPFMDGILDIKTEKFVDPTPAFFNKYSCPIPYVSLGKKTPHWDAFLDSISISHEGVYDTEMVELLQEWMGYLLTPDTSRHKMMIVVGPPRAGKGTLEYVIRKMLGDDSVGTFSAMSISESFGLEALVNKSLCVSPDYRNTGKVAVVTATILGLVANDPINVNAKFQPNRQEKLATRVMLFSNDAPEFRDVSGAMAARSLFIQLQNSFVGREDLKLKEKLSSEIEGIVAWSLEGLKRLVKNDKFTTPESSTDLVTETRQSDSPLFAFARDRIVFGEKNACSREDVYHEYTAWSEINGYGHPKNKQAFLREFGNILIDQVFISDQTTVTVEQASTPGRGRYWRGIGLLSDGKRETYTRDNPPNMIDRAIERREQTNHF